MRGYKLTFSTGEIRFIAAYSADWSSDRVITLERNNEQKAYYGVVNCEEVDYNVKSERAKD